MNPVLRQMLDHRFTKAHVFGYLDGELDRPARERVERHASVCPRCRAVMASLRRMIEELSFLTCAPRESVADGVLERLRHAV